MDLHALTQLGKDTRYPDSPCAELLQAIPRQFSRAALGLDPEAALPFHGVDLWTHYELSWLDAYGKPCVAIGELRVPAESTNIIESKSLKLYFNGLNFTRFDSPQAFVTRVEADLSAVAAAAVTLDLLDAGAASALAAFPGTCLDDLALDTDIYTPDPSLIRTREGMREDAVWHSHLLRTNCPVTDQPDWASIIIHARGPALAPESLLAYLVSYRRHSDFHEQCVERIFYDLMTYAGLDQLTVYARYTRRGGLDINPFRSNFETLSESLRVARQ
ncbi:MAG: NADPH-dependent 7-cyano-7-deazaguanine reductase QueF [Paraperlucidibaca sp.]